MSKTKTIPLYETPLKAESLQQQKNIPLTGKLVKALPIGYTVTGILPNRRMRRAYLNYKPHTNQRKTVNKRGVNPRLFFLQEVYNASKELVAKIVHKIKLV